MGKKGMIFLLHFTQKYNFIKISLQDMNKALYQTKNFVIAANYEVGPSSERLSLHRTTVCLINWNVHPKRGHTS
jgi:hypothetical protein